MEIWKEIEGFEGYKVSNLGRIWSDKSKRTIGWKNNKGYDMVDLFINGERKHKQIHRLVAKAFIHNLDDKPIIDHIIPVSLGGTNEVTNIRWATYKDNMNNELTLKALREKEFTPTHRKHISEALKGHIVTEETRRKLSEKNKGKQVGKDNATAKQIIQLTLEGEFVREWECVADAEESLSPSSNRRGANISTCCKGKRPKAYGYKWVFKDNYLKET